MTGNIVQFSAFAAAAKQAKAKPESSGARALAEYWDARIARQAARLAEVSMAPETLTETCKNQRLRLSRRDAWWAARRLTEYRRARLDWNTALGLAQEYNIGDASSYPKCDDMGENRAVLVDQWRTALMQHMLTPAPDAAAVAWKRAQLRAENYRYSGVTPERLQCAIDADVEWLEAHPSKKRQAKDRE